MSLYFILFLVISILAVVIMCVDLFFFFFKQKTAYEMRISDWSSDVCSSDLRAIRQGCGRMRLHERPFRRNCRRDAPLPARCAGREDERYVSILYLTMTPRTGITPGRRFLLT